MSELKQIADSLNLMLGGNGVYGIKNSVTYTGKKFRVIRFNEASQITVLKDEAGVNLLTLHNMDTTNWGAGTVFKPANGALIAEITLSSGSANGII